MTLRAIYHPPTCQLFYSSDDPDLTQSTYEWKALTNDSIRHFCNFESIFVEYFAVFRLFIDLGGISRIEFTLSELFMINLLLETDSKGYEYKQFNK